MPLGTVLLRRECLCVQVGEWGEEKVAVGLKYLEYNIRARSL